jgi:hypothetical protein
MKLMRCLKPEGGERLSRNVLRMTNQAKIRAALPSDSRSVQTVSARLRPVPEHFACAG